MKIVVLGDEMFCTAFRLAGVQDARVFSSPEQVEELMLEGDVGVVIAQEEVLASLPSRIAKAIESVPKPMFIGLSLKGKPTGESLDSLVKRALGVELK